MRGAVLEKFVDLGYMQNANQNYCTQLSGNFARKDSFWER